MQIQIFDDVEALSRAAAGAFAEAANESIADRGRFAVALTGGRTPGTLYRLLAAGFRDRVPWEKVHFFWSDERFVPNEHPESNYRMAREYLLEPLALSSDNVHPPDTGRSGLEEAARGYEDEIRDFFGNELPRFDWMLLGLGEDGHVASLFPGSSLLDASEERLVLAVRDSPKPPPERLTMTLPLICRARQVHFLVSGEGKRKALAQTLGEEGPELPARRVVRGAEHVSFWIDRDAAPAELDTVEWG